MIKQTKLITILVLRNEFKISGIMRYRIKLSTNTTLNKKIIDGAFLVIRNLKKQCFGLVRSAS